MAITIFCCIYAKTNMQMVLTQQKLTLLKQYDNKMNYFLKSPKKAFKTPNLSYSFIRVKFMFFLLKRKTF